MDFQPDLIVTWAGRARRRRQVRDSWRATWRAAVGYGLIAAALTAVLILAGVHG
jgi:hypothetical protein